VGLTPKDDHVNFERPGDPTPERNDLPADGLQIEFTEFELGCIEHLRKSLPTTFKSIESDAKRLRSYIHCEYPERHVTFDPDFKYQRQSYELNDLVDIARHALFIFKSFTLDHVSRKRIGLVPEGLSNDEFKGQCRAQLNDLFRCYRDLSAHPAAKTPSLPESEEERFMLAVGALIAQVLYGAAANYDCSVGLEFEQSEIDGKFGSAQAEISNLYQYAVLDYVKFVGLVDFPAQARTIIQTLNDLIYSGSPLSSRRELRKVSNVKEAQAFVDRLEKVTVADVLRANEIILSGIDYRAGKLRNYEVVVGNKDARDPCVLSDSIPAELEKWLASSFGALDDSLSEAEIYLKAAMLIVGYQHLHPTMDGNGRTGHVLVNSWLKRRGYSGFDVPRADEPEYISAIDRGDAEDYSALLELLRRYPDRG